MARTRTMASSFGQSAAQALRASRPGSACGRPGPSSRLSSPAIAEDCVLIAMPAHLLAQPVGHLGRQLGDLDRVDPARPVPGNRVLLDDPAWPAAQDDHPVTETGGLADVV